MIHQAAHRNILVNLCPKSGSAEVKRSAKVLTAVSAISIVKSATKRGDFMLSARYAA